MGIFTATARNLFVCLSFFLFLVSLTVPSRPVLAQSQKPVAQSQKLAVSYDEKRRQANDIAVTVVVSGISCTCARFTEDIRNVVNDLGPDGVRVLPVLGVGGGASAARTARKQAAIIDTANRTHRVQPNFGRGTYFAART